MFFASARDMLLNPPVKTIFLPDNFPSTFVFSSGLGFKKLRKLTQEKMKDL